MQPENPKLIRAATWAGRQQAFAVMAARCTLAQVRCLSHIRQTRAYREYGLTWDQFCVQHAGISRSRADQLIRQFKEFGATYFRLAEIANFTEDTYRKLAPHIQNETLRLAGEEIPILPENAPRIRAAIHSFRDEIRTLQTEMIFHRPQMMELHKQLDALLDEFRRRARSPLPDDQRDSVAGLLRYTITRMRAVAREFKHPAA